LEIREALGAADMELCRALFLEYQRALGVDLAFQGFERELAGLPGAYAPPGGRLFVALAAGTAAGCVGLRPLSQSECEMKRLYVRDGARGAGLGLALASRVVACARALGYSRIRLDTLPSMAAAQALYARLGFRDTPPYNDNPIAGTRFMALDL
jgi:GNAT superfamily N-acetyltransferase